jgi:hypothetical protein
MRKLTAALFVVLGVAVCAPAAAFEPYTGNEIECFDPIMQQPHDTPVDCARYVGELVGEDFKGPGHGARYFTDAGMTGKNDRRLTPADIMLGPDRQNGACVHARELP